VFTCFCEYEVQSELSYMQLYRVTSAVGGWAMEQIPPPFLTSPASATFVLSLCEAESKLSSVVNVSGGHLSSGREGACASVRAVFLCFCDRIDSPSLLDQSRLGHLHRVNPIYSKRIEGFSESRRLTLARYTLSPPSLRRFAKQGLLPVWWCSDVVSFVLACGSLRIGVRFG